MDWDSIEEMGRKAGAKFPELVAAQWALESGWGQHESGINNVFGIKGQPGTLVTTQEWTGTQFVTIEDYFKNYNSVQECVDDLVMMWYKDYRGYQGVNRAETREEAAYLLKEEGYATDPVYPELLINLMDDNHEEADPRPQEPLADDLLRAAKYFNSEEHQEAAWRWLQGQTDPDIVEEFLERYRKAPETSGEFPMKVEYFGQLDSNTGHAERMCFSSAMSMALNYIDPDKFLGDDDWYLNEVFRFGDTVSTEAQEATAIYLGYDADFRMDGTEQDLLDLLDKGVPVPIGILHTGPISAPTGGGHWVTLIGYDDEYFHVHDPAGELDLIAGGYLWGSGENQRYTRKNLMKRWNIANPSDGWYMKLD